MSDEDKTAFLAVTQKYPVANVMVPKVDFERANADYLEADSYVKKWEQYKTESWDDEHGMPKAQWEVEQKLVELSAKNAALETGTYVPPGAGMEFSDVEKFINEKGYVTKADLAGLAKKEDVDSTLNAKLNQQGLNTEFFFTRSATVPLKYMKEFGSTDGFDMADFMALVVNGGNRYLKDPADPTGNTPVKNFDAAYDAYVSVKRLDAQREALEKERAAIAKEREDLTVQRTAPPSPTDDGRGGVIPPFQRRIQGMDKGDPTLGGDAPFGSGVLAQQIAESYRKGELPLPGKVN